MTDTTKNLINLKDLEKSNPERAKAIRSLGGKASQELRKKKLSLHNCFNDYFKINSYYDKELEKIVASNGELNSYQKKTIKREFLVYLIERGYIREAELTDEERASLLLANIDLTESDLKKYFKTRYKKPKAKSKARAKAE